jgi:hypothetical protein
MGGLVVVETAPAAAGDAGDAAVFNEVRQAPATEGPRTIGVLDAAELTGLSVSTVQRRVDAWQRGDRSDYALKGGTAGATSSKGATRYVDRLDAEALAKQLVGELPAGRHIRER